MFTPEEYEKFKANASASRAAGGSTREHDS